jgi:hypothetical protein
MGTSGPSYRRAKKGPKPLSVPAIVAVIGVLLFFVGIPIGSADVSALGMIFLLWGASSLSILLIRRNRRAHRA